MHSPKGLSMFDTRLILPAIACLLYTSDAADE